VRVHPIDNGICRHRIEAHDADKIVIAELVAERIVQSSNFSASILGKKSLGDYVNASVKNCDVRHPPLSAFRHKNSIPQQMQLQLCPPSAYN
jgi:hypothetical protein